MKHQLLSRASAFHNLTSNTPQIRCITSSSYSSNPKSFLITSTTHFLFVSQMDSIFLRVSVWCSISFIFSHASTLCSRFSRHRKGAMTSKNLLREEVGRVFMGVLASFEHSSWVCPVGIPFPGQDGEHSGKLQSGHLHKGQKGNKLKRKKSWQPLSEKDGVFIPFSSEGSALVSITTGTFGKRHT